MVRLVDGSIVEEDDPSWQWRSSRINLFGFRVAILPWGVLIAAFFFLKFGIAGIAVFAVVAGIVLYCVCMTDSTASTTAVYSTPFK